MTVGLEMIARASASGVTNSLIEGTVVALFAWASLRAAGKWHSSIRFSVWFAALLTIGLILGFGGWGAQASGASRAATVTLPSSWAEGIFSLWALGAFLSLLRVGAGFWQIAKLRRSCETLAEENLEFSVRETLQSLTRRTPARVCVSHDVRVPTAIGFFKPLVLLPAWGVNELSAEELNSVLIHEFEHLRRHDDWSNLAQRVLGALLFFHPAVWWIEQKLALEREMACDEAVLARTENPHAYAACLVTVAEKSLMRRGLALAQAAVSRMRQTTVRVTQILSNDRKISGRTRKSAGYWAMGMACSGIFLISQVPPLVGFRSDIPSVASSVGSTVEPTTLVSVKHDERETAPHGVLAHAKDVVRATAKRSVPKASTLLAKLPSEQPVAVNGIQLAKTEAVVPAQTMLVVMHTEQYNQYGGMMWTICVWQVDVPGAALVNRSKTIPAKSI